VSAERGTRNAERRGVGRRWFAATALALLAAGCQQKMAQQPYYRPYEPSAFFADGRSARPLEEGVIARGQNLDDSPLASGLTPEGRKARPLAAAVGLAADAAKAAPGSPDSPANYVTEYPFEITAKELQRGQERYTIFCTPCHGALGDGKGKIVERGYLQPPSYFADNSRGFERWGIKVPLREVPAGYIFEFITKGYGGMPAHAAQVHEADRWRITAYVRALQLSRHAVVKDLPEAVRAEATKALGEKP
jgi:mono/diheme cytochrome c family protein